ncbi:unnamed protein product [marine sediment metagenome]|uniref:Uncharacterized protein n=1 Tax=marine sediment metagenome TaxID=412755 RepID=X1MC50_9ZZZZ
MLKKINNVLIHFGHCARCGKYISGSEYIKNTKNFIIIGISTIMHFCNACRNILNNGEL